MLRATDDGTPTLILNLAARPRLAALAATALMFTLIVALVLGISPPGMIGGGPWPKLLFLLRMVLLLAAATGLLRLQRLGWRDVGLRRPPGWGRFALAVPLGLVLCAVFATVVRLGQSAAHAASGPATDYAAFAPIEHQTAEYLFWVLPASWGSAAFGEEMLFRGVVLDGLRRGLGGGRWATAAAVAVQAVLFGSLHLYQGLSGATVATALGVALGLVWWGSGRNLWAGIVIHGLLDSSAMTAIYLGALHMRPG